MAFYTQGVAFDNLETVLKIYRKQGRSKEEVLSFFSSAVNQQVIRQKYDSVQPLTVGEALRLTNAEQRMVALQCFEVEEFVRRLNAQLLDKQTISKTQMRWDAQLKPYEHTYDDTYELGSVN